MWLNQPIKVHHVADGTNLFYISKPVKKLNKLVSIDLKNLVNWLNETEISLNAKGKKTEMVIFI